VQYELVAVDRLAQLISVVVVVTIELDVEITDDVYRLLQDGDPSKDGGQLVEELLCHSGR